MIDEINKLDFVGIDDVDSSLLRLGISDHLKWKREYVHLNILQDKLNTYIDFILNEEYRNHYTYNIEKFEIIIYFKYNPPKSFINFLSSFNNEITKNKWPIKITYEHLIDK